jgi:hypothetical protein
MKNTTRFHKVDWVEPFNKIASGVTAVPPSTTPGLWVGTHLHNRPRTQLISTLKQRHAGKIVGGSHQTLLRRLVRLSSMSIPILLAESERLFT